MRKNTGGGRAVPDCPDCDTCDKPLTRCTCTVDDVHEEREWGGLGESIVIRYDYNGAGLEVESDVDIETASLQFVLSGCDVVWGAMLKGEPTPRIGDYPAVREYVAKWLDRVKARFRKQYGTPRKS